MMPNRRSSHEREHGPLNIVCCKKPDHLDGPKCYGSLIQ